MYHNHSCLCLDQGQMTSSLPVRKEKIGLMHTVVSWSWTVLEPGYYAGPGLFVTHSQSDTLCGHILASRDHVSPPALIKCSKDCESDFLLFVLAREVKGWWAQLTQPLPSRTFCKIILFTSQISKLLLSPFKYRASRRENIFTKWKVLTDEKRGHLPCVHPAHSGDGDEINIFINHSTFYHLKESNVVGFVAFPLNETNHPFTIFIKQCN